MFKTTPTEPAHIELHTPPELEPYMRTAREVAAATLDGSNGRNWLINLEPRIHSFVAAAIVAVSYDGVAPGDLPMPTIVRRSVVEPYRDRSLIGVWNDDKSALGENLEATRAYRADQEALEVLRAEVERTADEILSDPARARAAYLHFLAIEEARHMLDLARQSEAASLEIAVRYTDPITGVCDPTHGEITARSVMPGAPLPQYEHRSNWYAVESSALTHLLIQHTLAQRVLERRPDLARSVEQVVDRLMREASL